MVRLPRPSDLSRLPGAGTVAAQLEALAGVPTSLAALNRGVRGLAEALESTRGSMLALQRVAERADSLLEDLEPPLRRLAPQLDRLADLAEDPELASLLRSLRDAQALLAQVTGSTDRLGRLVDDAGGRLSGLPGGSLLTRGLRSGSVWGEVIRGEGARAAVASRDEDEPDPPSR
jgi:ABC-type transporter Mla subunit MlaD